MSNNNRNRSTPSTSGGSGGREVNRPHRRNTDHAQTGSSSARSQRGNDRSASSSVSLNGTGGQAPDTDHRQTHLRPGWIMRDGHWYYHTSDGRSYRWEDNVDSVVQDAGEYHGVPVDNNGVPNDDRAYRSWDESSQRANQGSAYFGSTPAGTEPDTHRPPEEPLPIQDPFLQRDDPWSPFNMLSYVGSAASQGNTNRDGAYMGQGQAAASWTIYPAMSDSGEDDNENPTSSAPHA